MKTTSFTRRFAAALAAVSFCVSLVACGGGNAGTDSSSSAGEAGGSEVATESGTDDTTDASSSGASSAYEDDSAGLVIVDSGYTTSTEMNSFGKYDTTIGLEITNTSDLYVEFAKVIVVCNGEANYDDYYYLPTMAPGQTIYKSMEEIGYTPDDVLEFRIVDAEGETTPVMSEPVEQDDFSYDPSSFTYAVSDTDRDTISGEVTNTSGESMQGYSIDIVFYKDGSIIGGENGFLYPTEDGETASFSISIEQTLGGSIREYDEIRASVS